MAHHGFLIPGVLRPNIPDYGRALVSQMAGNANGTREVLSNGRVIDTPAGASGLPTLSVVPAWSSFTDRIARSKWNYIATGIWTGDTGTAPYGLRVHTRRGILNIPRNVRNGAYSSSSTTVTPNFSGAFAKVEITTATSWAYSIIPGPVPANTVAWGAIEITAGSVTTANFGIHRSGWQGTYDKNIVSGPGALSGSTALNYIYNLTSSATVLAMSTNYSANASGLCLYPKNTSGTVGSSVLVRSMAICAGIPDRPVLFNLWTAPINVVYDNSCRVFLYPEDLF